MKSDIKSKKQKMNQKKFSKGNTPHLIDLIQSSSQNYEVERVQKRRNNSNKTPNQNQNKLQPNYLNIDRIKKAVIDNKGIAEKLLQKKYQNDKQYQVKKGENDLLVVESVQSQPLLNINDRSLFSYRVQGKQGIKYISQLHFKGRINSQIKQLKSIQQRKYKNDEQQLQRILNGSCQSQDQDKIEKQLQITEQNQKPIYQQRKRESRYYEEQLSDEDQQQAKNIVRCFRCNKKGHKAKNCLEQQPRIQCNFCQGQHHHSVCDTSPCFKCCQPGHISQDCTSKGIECRKCRKKGHKSQSCGIFMYLDYQNKTDQDIKKRYTISDLKKLKCLSSCKNPDGHFNCFNYKSSKGPKPYMDNIEKKNNFYSYSNNKSQNNYSQNNYSQNNTNNYRRK